ncbi:MAG: type II secretion system protein [bacterium]|nr:type II secretion system protein [bacterium]
MVQPRKSRYSERGMSLVEIIVVIVMLGIVAYPLTGLAKANLKGLAQYSQMQKAQFDLQSQMEQVLADFSSLGYDGLKTGWQEKTGKTGSGLFNYHVTFTADVVRNSITCSDVTVTLSGGTLREPISLTTMISKQ